MKKNTDRIELNALKKICSHLETVASKYAAKHSAIVKGKNDLLESGVYKNERDIQEAYGWAYITEEEMNTLFDALEKGAAAAEEDTVWSVAGRIIRNDIRGYKQEIYEIEYQMLTPEQKRKRDEENAKFAEEQEERRKRLWRGSNDS